MLTNIERPILKLLFSFKCHLIEASKYSASALSYEAGTHVGCVCAGGGGRGAVALRTPCNTLTTTRAPVSSARGQVKCHLLNWHSVLTHGTPQQERIFLSSGNLLDDIAPAVRSVNTKQS